MRVLTALLPLLVACLCAQSAAADPPFEKFAEAYSVCARFRTLQDMYFGMYDYSPSPATHARVCALIRETGRTAAAARRR